MEHRIVLQDYKTEPEDKIVCRNFGKLRPNSDMDRAYHHSFADLPEGKSKIPVAHVEYDHLHPHEPVR